MDHAMDSPTPYPDACRARIKRRMENFLAPHASSLESIVHEETVLESASAVVALTSHFRFVHADLVVLGTHELSRIAGFFIGTNAENLLNDATVSVLAVRD